MIDIHKMTPQAQKAFADLQHVEKALERALLGGELLVSVGMNEEEVTAFIQSHLEKHAPPHH